MSKWAIVTGATAGIGKETSIQLAKNGWNLVITGRRDERLKELTSSLKDSYKIQAKSLCFDISNRSECQSIFEENKALLSQCQVLINNAGLARGIDKIQDANINDWEEMIDTNVKGLLYMTRLSLPLLKEHSSAHIVNIGSVAGRWSYPGGGVYCSTKFAVRAISESLRMDLLGENIRVTNISPGLVETEFSEVRLRDTEKAKTVYQGMKALSPEDIAECIVWSLNRPEHVNIQEMVVFPTAQASVNHVHRT